VSDWISIDPLPQMLTPTQEYIKEQLAAGKTPQAIAHRLHLRADHVAEEIYEIRKKECTMGKALTEEQKAQILEMRARGKSYHSIAMAVGCAQQTCANVCNAAKLKAELEAEQAADFPETQEAPENLPEKKAKSKPGKINEDFDAAVDQMIADADKNAAIAEEKSTITEKPKKKYEKPIISDSIVERVPDSIIRTVKLRIRSICEEVGRNVAEVDRLTELTNKLVTEAAELTAWVEAHL
jgi:DNA-binding CsgD family transcriptional regulator